jgi:hypothetical protein
MSDFEKKKLLDIYEILISGRIEQARYLLEVFLDIQEKTNHGPEVA